MNNNHDLDWLAFQYLSDELSAEEHVKFESRLESDPEAQQALVDAMDLSQLIYAAVESSAAEKVELASSITNSTSNRQRQRRPILKRVEVLLAAAAALLFAISAWSMLPQTNSDSDVADNQSIPADLAVAWAETVQDKDLLVDNINDDIFGDENELASLDFDTPNEEDWMLVALSDFEESGEME